MLKEKIRALKQKNGDLVVALKELQERVWLLEEKA
jgi:NACalpha-BTF3-like transcription factor